MKVVGLNKSSYKNKKGETSNPIRVYCTYENEATEGVVVTDLFIGEKSTAYPEALRLKLGDEIQPFYNRFGSVEMIAVTPSTANTASTK